MEASTSNASSVVWIENQTKDVQVIADMGKEGVAFGGIDDKFEPNVKSFSRDEVDGSMGLQVCLEVPP